MWLLYTAVLAFIIFIRVKERRTLEGFCTVFLYKYPQELRAWKSDVSIYKYKKDDERYLIGYGGSKFDMATQVRLMDELVKRVERMKREEEEYLRKNPQCNQPPS